MIYRLYIFIDHSLSLLYNRYYLNIINEYVAPSWYLSCSKIPRDTRILTKIKFTKVSDVVNREDMHIYSHRVSLLPVHVSAEDAETQQDPPLITHIKIHSFVRLGILLEWLPSSLTHLKLSKDYNPRLSDRDLNDILPNLTTLEFRFNDRLALNNVVWPRLLTSIKFSPVHNIYYLNQFPSTLKELRLLGNFDQPLENIQRFTQLEVLELGRCFNHTIDDLPETVKEIHVGTAFEKNISRLPTNLLVLVLDFKYCKTIHCTIPQSITRLEIGICQIHEDSVPSTLRRLYLPRFQSCRIFSRLEHLTYLELYPEFNDTLDYIRFPVNLTTLKFGSFFDQPIDTLVLCKNLRLLIFGMKFNQSIAPLYHLEELERLELSECFNQPINNLPKSLRVLKLGQNFDQSFERLAPPLKRVYVNKVSQSKLSERWRKQVSYRSIELVPYTAFFEDGYEYMGPFHISYRYQIDEYE